MKKKKNILWLVIQYSPSAVPSYYVFLNGTALPVCVLMWFCKLEIWLHHIYHIYKVYHMRLSYHSFEIYHSLVVKCLPKTSKDCNSSPVGDLLLFKVYPSQHLKKFSVLFVLHWSNIWCSVELVVSCDCFLQSIKSYIILLPNISET